MALVRTNITLPEETLALVDAVAGRAAAARYIAERRREAGPPRQRAAGLREVRRAP